MSQIAAFANLDKVPSKGSAKVDEDAGQHWSKWVGKCVISTSQCSYQNDEVDKEEERNWDKYEVFEEGSNDRKAHNTGHCVGQDK